MLIILALLIMLSTSLIIASMLKLKSKIAFLLAVFLISFAQIVLVEEIASTLYLMNSQFFILGLHLLLLALTTLYWKHQGKPTILAPLKQFLQKKHKIFSRQEILKHPEIFILAIVVCISSLFEIFLIFYVPPNTHDVMATHLARVGYWLQNGSFFPWDTFNNRQIFYPINAGLQVSWLVLFFGSEKVVGFVQWFGMLSALLAIYGSAHLFGFSKHKALLTSLLFATFPIVVMQSTTGQLDLIVGALFGTAIYFLLLGLKQNNHTALSLSGLALSLALGTKQIILFFLPGLALFWLLILIKEKQAAVKGLKIWLASTLIAFVIFGLYINAINYFKFGNPLGPRSSISSQTADLAPAAVGERLLYNGSRLLYVAADPVGSPQPLKGYSIKAKAYTLAPLLHELGIDLESDSFVSTNHNFEYLGVPHTTEDEAWFGWLGFLLVISGIIYNLFLGIKRHDTYRLGIILMCIMYFTLIVLLRPGWDPYQGRYFIPLVIVCAPFMAIPEGNKLAAHLLHWAFVSVAILILITTHLANEGKPLIGPLYQGTHRRIENITIQNRSLYRDMLKMFEHYVPHNAAVGLICYDNSWEYLLFGENLERKIIPILPYEKISHENWLHEQGIKYVLINRNIYNNVNMPLPHDLVKIRTEHDWELYKLKDD